MIEQGEEEGDAADADAGEEASADGGAEGSDLEEGEIEQRVGYRFGVEPVAGEQGEREGGEGSDFEAAEGVLAEDFQDVGEERDAGAEEDEAYDVEGMGVFAVVG